MQTGRTLIPLCLALLLCLSACGFRLKGEAPLPFTTLYTNISPDTEFGVTLRRALQAASPGLTFVDRYEDAQAILAQLSMEQRMQDVAIDVRGRIEEYELTLNFEFQLTDAQGHLLLEPTHLRAQRELPYDPEAILASESEIATVFRVMQKSMIDRILRRLAAPEVAQAWHNAEQQPRAAQALDTLLLPAQEPHTPVPR